MSEFGNAIAALQAARKAMRQSRPRRAAIGIDPTDGSTKYFPSSWMRSRYRRRPTYARRSYGSYRRGGYRRRSYYGRRRWYGRGGYAADVVGSGTFQFLRLLFTPIITLWLVGANWAGQKANRFLKWIGDYNSKVGLDWGKNAREWGEGFENELFNKYMGREYRPVKKGPDGKWVGMGSYCKKCGLCCPNCHP